MSSHRKRMRRARRDTVAIANHRLPRRRLVDLSRIVIERPLVIDDRRAFSFRRERHAPRLFDRVVPFDRSKVLPFRTAFPEPKRVMLCVRRKQRREVLLALGRGGGGNRRPRRTKWSDIQC